MIPDEVALPAMTGLDRMPAASCSGTHITRARGRHCAEVCRFASFARGATPVHVLEAIMEALAP